MISNLNGLGSIRVHEKKKRFKRFAVQVLSAPPDPKNQIFVELAVVLRRSE